MRITPSNPETEKEGVWTEYYGVRLRIRRLSHVELAAFRRDLNGQTADPWDRHMAPLAASLVMDWENFPGGHEPTASNVLNLMENDEEARMFVLNVASSMQAYVDGAKQVVAGNSPAASSGS